MLITSFRLFVCSWRGCPLFIAVFLVSIAGVAQENIRFERISTNEGLSQADIWSMCEDNFGFLWIGTRDGLNKYDGHSFINYRKNKQDTSSLFFNNISALEVDSIGNIWIGSVGGISMHDYASNLFKNYLTTDPDLRYMQVHHIAWFGGNILLSTNKGIISFDPTTKLFFKDPAFELLKDLDVFFTHYEKDTGWYCTDKG